MSLKDRISSPLEAGTSILDAHHLPPHLHPALEYASSRLAKKSLHVTLVVVRRDFQLPSVILPLGSPGLQTPTTPSSPPLSSSRFQFTSGPVTALKQLVRSASTSSRSNDNVASALPSPMFSPSILESSNPRLRWPLSPAMPMSPPPMTPSSMSSSTATDARASTLSNSFGMRLVHASGLPDKVEKALRDTLQRAEKKFNIGSQWLSPAVSPSACGLSNQLIRGSIIQNEPLYSSEGLTLLALDRLYSVKSALSSYSKTRSPMRLEDAVDELRRYILANNGRKVTRSDLVRSYDWLSVKNSAILDLDRMYRRAYGGPDQIGGISGMPSTTIPVIPEPVIRTDDDDDDDPDADLRDFDTTGVLYPKVQLCKPPTPKGPVLKLQTDFGHNPGLLSNPETKDKSEDGPGSVPQLGNESPIGLDPFNNSSIDQVLKMPMLGSDLLSPMVISPAVTHGGLGPLTPNGDDDISPITRGEWGFLMIDDAFKSGRTVAVETC